jgi:hypothetical protein
LKGLTFNAIVVGGLLIFAVYAIYTSISTRKERRWMDCEITFDSVLVVKPQNRGAFENVLVDSLIFSSGYKLFDQSLCESKELKRRFWKSNITSCSIADVELPFTIVKPIASDTLFVRRNGMTVLFRIPCDANQVN